MAKIGESTLIAPDRQIEALSFNLKTKKVELRKVTCFSKTKRKNILEITANTGHKIKVSDKHPMIIHEKDKFKVRFAKDLKEGDQIPLVLELPEKEIDNSIDLISKIPKGWYKKIRVKPLKADFRKFKDIISNKKEWKSNKTIQARIHDSYVKYNFLPLKLFLEIEDELPFDRESILLVTGRGPSTNQIKAIIPLDKDFMRLLGYYLSEGCVTKDKSRRVRFTFHSEESDLIEDTTNCLKKLGLNYSKYKDKNFKSLTIKASSNIFGFLIQNILKCGKDSYDAKIPNDFVVAPKKLRRELLKGLMRGDGGVYFENRIKNYKKNNKSYSHKTCSATANFFSISKELFHQTSLLLLSEGITHSFDKNRPLLTISGYKNLKKLIPIFSGEKKGKIEKYFKNKCKYTKSLNHQIYDTYSTVPIQSIKLLPPAELYSLEVEGTNTFVTDCGIITHNCISVDPYYLIEKAKRLGFDHKFLKLARTINNSMPRYTINLVVDALNNVGKSVKGSNIGILGLAYKGGVGDLRESPALHVVKALEEKGAKLKIFDPYIPSMSNCSIDEAINNVDAVVLLTSHQEFKDLDYSNSKIVIDGRNFLDKNRIKQTCNYFGIGRE